MNLRDVRLSRAFKYNGPRAWEVITRCVSCGSMNGLDMDVVNATRLGPMWLDEIVAVMFVAPAPKLRLGRVVAVNKKCFGNMWRLESGYL